MTRTLHRPKLRPSLADLLAPYRADAGRFRASRLRQVESPRVRWARWLRSVRGSAS